ncbi:DddA-like double-stranded DNA deaminase toxin [Streptoalloteichus tenebrarius]|uniref:DddA-like double-stranded DNA deaminase toxin n=1 Tax=Streptoalloteichus tenebrarius (strain ATCC 17920 / DSM 40477 / JCM 4838 / CBS 697.72 / NBRC 16177 / NCIMB 11028 / NRRL B-12390 / A12253. 1 / ISP 5477) TaxID=1933 RepID=UPI003557E51B
MTFSRRAAELVINNEMCRGPMSCLALLPILLLPGQTLIVRDPKQTRVFRGRTIS